MYADDTAWAMMIAIAMMNSKCNASHSLLYKHFSTLKYWILCVEFDKCLMCECVCALIAVCSRFIILFSDWNLLLLFEYISSKRNLNRLRSFFKNCVFAVDFLICFHSIHSVFFILVLPTKSMCLCVFSSVSFFMQRMRFFSCRKRADASNFQIKFLRSGKKINFWWSKSKLNNRIFGLKNFQSDASKILIQIENFYPRKNKWKLKQGKHKASDM